MKLAFAIPILVLAAPALADPRVDGFYGGHMWGGAGYGFLGAGMMILVWGALIVLAIMAARWLSGSPVAGPRGDSAMDILRQRLARGEIDTEEYEARRKALEG